MFSKTSISGMLPHFVAKAEKVASILDKIAESGKPVDIQDLFFRFTLDSIGEIGFGFSIDSLDKYNYSHLHSLAHSRFLTL